ncbi:MAG: selenocysteine-specific translation elongation factor [Syntrophus sp. (in: bacteria)]|nr:selenocysteine-specific translation elongation factor [Syntrophus sp. (in: bacteria)]
MKRIVVGTAGHIDHGKTTLVQALTGINCDRLKEEQERGITTELGFAHYRSDNDLIIGIVDVPGHEKFIRHMVAGAWGIDMALLVVAADEGVMPQTREHVDICELLGLKKGIIAITKADLVDEEMIELVEEDIKDFLKGRTLEGSPVIPVSAATGMNLDALKMSIRNMAMELQERSKEGIFRLPVDRVFTIRGLGTIITGTCISGSIKTGEEIEIYPHHKRAKIRNIQVYHEDAPEAVAGQRVALNLQGIERLEVERGTIIGKPDTLILSTRVDASLKYLNLPSNPIRSESTLRFHIATTQTEARLILLDQDKIEPGQEVFTQFVFPEPIVTLPGDRYILRGPYAIQTIGGGQVLDIMPKRHKRKTDSINTIFSLLSNEDLHAKAEYHILKGEHGGIKKGLLSILLGKEGPSIDPIVEEMDRLGKIKSSGKWIIHMDRFVKYKDMLQKLVLSFHEKNPLKVGISKEELRMRLPKVEPQVFQAALDECIASGAVESDKDKVKIKGTGDTPDKERDAFEGHILKILAGYNLTPPSLKDLALEMHKPEGQLRDILQKLVFEGKVVKIKGDMYFNKNSIEGFKKQITSFLGSHKEIIPGDIKSMFDLSRKYTIPLLEYLDEIKLTIRVGDKRVLRG